MGFEVPISGVDRGPGRGGRTAVAALAVFATVVALAVATGGAPQAGPVTGAAPASPPVAGTQGPAAALPRIVPGDLRCRDVDRATCLRMATAAVLALPGDAPEAIDATVWRSLLCNDSFDCPLSYLDGTSPLGSVIISFADGGPRAAVNVVDGRNADGRDRPIRRVPRAWVVRWMPQPG